MNPLAYRFAGLSLDSDVFECELEKLREEGYTKPKIHRGNHKQLTEQGFELGPEVYSGEELAIITTQNSSPVTLRVSKSDQGKEFLLPRYEGFTIEGVQDTEKLSTDLFYYLSITLERFISQNRVFYRDSFTSIDKAQRNEKDGQQSMIRESFLEKHFQGIPLQGKTLRSYKQMTRLLRDVISLRAAPEYVSSPEEILALANKPIDILPDEVTTPNHIIDRVLRLTILSVDAIILKNQVSQQSQEEDSGQMQFGFLEDLERSAKTDFVKNIRKSTQEAQGIHSSCLKLRLNTTESDERHRLKNRDYEKAFERMTFDIAGDLLKTIGLCKKLTPEMMVLFGNTQILQNRIFKITDCLEDISEIGHKIKPLINGANNHVNMIEFVHLTRQLISISERDEDAMKDVRQQQGASEYKLREYTRVLASYGSAEDRFKAQTINKTLDYILDLSHSKRANPRTDDILEKIKQAQNFEPAKANEPTRHWAANRPSSARLADECENELPFDSHFSRG